VSEARARVDDWVAAGLLLQRGATPGVELLALVRPWIEATLEVVALLPPIGVVADLGRLLARAPFDIAKSERVADPELRAAIDAYEEHVLGRLAADFRLEAARDALVRLDESLRPAATAVFVEQVLARLQQAGAAEDDELDSPGPAAIRRVLHRHGVELLERGAAVLAEPAASLRSELARAYAKLARSARRSAALIGDVELYTLENHTALRSPSLRLAMAQIAEAAQIIERSLPVRVRRSEASRGRTPTRVEDESAYPIGGYASISTVGGIESLVSSELIYMSPPAERAAGSVDLFDVRWAAGELLKYTRDESVHTRERRTVCFALDPSLERARVKDPGLPFQRLVIGLGGIVTGVRKLCAWLDESELHLHLLAIARTSERPAAHSQPLREELELARLILREYIESGVVEILEIMDPEAARTHAREAASRGASDLVWLLGERWIPTERRANGPGRSRDYREHACSLAEATPRIWVDRGQGSEAHAVFGESWDTWVRALSELTQALV
jgi:hypothetical protein